jgi:hypothetical protein
MHSIKMLDAIWFPETPSWYGLVLFFFFCCVLGETTPLDEVVEEVATNEYYLSGLELQH